TGAPRPQGIQTRADHRIGTARAVSQSLNGSWIMHSTKLKVVAVAAFALAAPFAAQAECPFPKAPASIPDGKTANEAEMVAAMNAFKAYNEAVTAFGVCLEEETKAKAAGTAQLMQLKT